MRRLITISYFTLFTALFMIASVLYFKDVARPVQPEIDAILEITLLAIGAGVGLTQVFYLFDIVQVQRFTYRTLIGAALGISIFSTIFFSEHIMSTIQLTRAMRDPDVFSSVSGHCGVYSGRGLMRWYQLTLQPSIQNKMEAFHYSNQCRIEHFLNMRQRQQLPCQNQEEALACLSRWMLTFSKKGYWNFETRKMFFGEAQRGVIKSNDADVDKKWAAYAMIDYELEKLRLPVIQQAGIGEEFNDLHHFFAVKDEYDNLNLTKEVFSTAEKFLQEDRTQTTEITKFKEIRKEVNLKLEKIPELEENLKSIQSKISYNPSP